MTKLHITMAMSALTLTLAPQVQAYATDDDISLAEPMLARLTMVEPLQSQPSEMASCEMNVLDLLALAAQQGVPLDRQDMAALSCAVSE